MYLSINRYTMECKGIPESTIYSWRAVLIDTLWNVKKDRLSKYHYFQYRINRYTMECKGVYRIVAASQIVVLIDTLWNVKALTRMAMW